VGALGFPEAVVRIVLRDGAFCAELSTPAASLPAGVFAGPLSRAPPAVAAALAPALAAAVAATTAAAGAPRGASGVLPALSAACCSDAVALLLPPGVSLPQPVHVLHLATAAAGGAADTAGTPFSAPRLLIHLGAGAEATLVEEYAVVGGGGGGGAAAVASVADVVLHEGASLRHAYVTACAGGGAQLGCARVAQATRSSYALTHVSLAARGLARHDVSVAQLGPDTRTEQRSYLLVGADGCGDYHSALELAHPGGAAKQLHKCIAAASTARGVFDGGVRVGRAAQRTDAQQLSRNLLLAPRATVHAKPNLQIIADDVVCTHGCTVSDLDEESLFYFQARGIDAAAARVALVASFGAEVVDALPAPALVSRVRLAVRNALEEAARG
jgi:Fe-S cluster assembly protein SufD